MPGNALGSMYYPQPFYRTYDVAPDDYNDTSFPATVGDFRLDKLLGSISVDGRRAISRRAG